jgi:hypothetical protein
MFFLSLFAGMITTHQVRAQELKDYVITMKGDTIYGEISSVKSIKKRSIMQLHSLKWGLRKLEILTQKCMSSRKRLS